MKKLGFLFLCILVFVGTLLIFLPEETSASPWWCYWYPPEDCAAEGGTILVTQCNKPACMIVASAEQICVVCQR